MTAVRASHVGIEPPFPYEERDVGGWTRTAR
jgi:hypothetical protein